MAPDQHVEGADEVDVDDLAVRVQNEGRRVLTVAPDGALRPPDAGRVDEIAQWSELDGGRDGLLVLVGLGHVDRDEHTADVLGEGLALLGVEVRHDNLRTLGGELTDDGCADARRAARDDRTCSRYIHGFTVTSGTDRYEGYV